MPQGHLSCVAAGDAAQQLLQLLGAAEPLQVCHQGKGTIALAHPAQSLPASQAHLQQHLFGLACKTRNLSTPLGRELQGLQAGGKSLGIAQHGWQDGEVGQGSMTAYLEPSDHGQAVQWPLPPDGVLASMPLRLGVMASGAGSNFEALVDCFRHGSLCGEVALLVVNNRDCGAQRRAERLGIAWQLHDHRLQPNRQQLDQALVQAFRTASVDLVVMAGWMRVVTPILIGAFPNRLINIHPSLLPSFRGLDAVGQALAAGVTLAGCTAHLVSEEVDAGRILVQAAVPVLSGDDHASLSRRIQVQEHRILPLAVALAAQG